MTETATVESALARAHRDVERARARLHEEQEAAWRRYVDAVEQALAVDLRLPAGEAEPEPDDEDEDPIRELVDALAARFDNMKVQAKLGRMEARDLLEELRDELHDAARKVATFLRT